MWQARFRVFVAYLSRDLSKCFDWYKAIHDMVGWHHQLDKHESESSKYLWWTGKPGMLQCMGSQNVGPNWETELKPFMHFLTVLLVSIESVVMSPLSAALSSTLPVNFIPLFSLASQLCLLNLDWPGLAWLLPECDSLRKHSPAVNCDNYKVPFTYFPSLKAIVLYWMMFNIWKVCFKNKQMGPNET